MKSIIRFFILNEKEDQHAAGYSYRQACDVDEGIPFVPSHVPDRDFEIVYEHIKPPASGLRDKLGNGRQSVDPEPKNGFFSAQGAHPLFEIFFDIALKALIQVRKVHPGQKPKSDPGRTRLFVWHQACSFLNDSLETPAQTLLCLLNAFSRTFRPLLVS